MRFMTIAAACLLTIASLPVSAQLAMPVLRKQPCSNIASLPAIISAPGTYCLAADLTTTLPWEAIKINAGNVTLDCKGHSVAKTAGDPLSTTGIRTQYNGGLSNVTVQNCVIRGFEDGISVHGDRTLISNNTLDRPMVRGIVASGNGVRVIGNRVFNAHSTTANDFQENISVTSSEAPPFVSSTGVVVMNNIIAGSHGNSSITGLRVDGFGDSKPQLINNQILDIAPSSGGEAYAIGVGGNASLINNSVMVRRPGIPALVGSAGLCTGNVFIGTVVDLGEDGVAGIARCDNATGNLEKP